MRQAPSTNSLMTRRTLLKCAGLAAAAAFDAPHILAGRPSYQASWDSLAQHPDAAWFQDAKFGIYFHWGIYSVPAFDNEWYSRNMYIEGQRANRVSQARLRARLEVWLQRLSPHVSRGEIQSPGVGGTASAGQGRSSPDRLPSMPMDFPCGTRR